MARGSRLPKASGGSRFVVLPRRGRVVEGHHSAFERSPVGCLRLEGTTVLSRYVVPNVYGFHVLVQAHHFSQRTRRLHDLHESVSGPRADSQFSESFEIEGREMFAHACKIGLEGVVSKVRDSAHASGRGNTWPKPPTLAPCRPDTRRCDAPNPRHHQQGPPEKFKTKSPAAPSAPRLLVAVARSSPPHSNWSCEKYGLGLSCLACHRSMVHCFLLDQAQQVERRGEPMKELLRLWFA